MHKLALPKNKEMIVDPSKYEELAEEIMEVVNSLMKNNQPPDFEDVIYIQERVDILEAVARAKKPSELSPSKTNISAKKEI